MVRFKFLTIIFMFLLILFGSGITFSFFNSNVSAINNDIDIAKFIFNTKSLDQLQLPIIDLKPGDTQEYDFSVTNNELGKVSSVVIEYKIIIKTYHIMPLEIQLFRVNDNNEELVLTCDESFSRNDNNELVCNSPSQELKYSVEEANQYKLKLKFPQEYNQESNANLVDFINLEINSWQKTGD